mmetsp:Transcript_14526/g.37373  ORF Transcript_14526/g.37373 Transcript_14526/m.37373 type:complete len:290 (-) Transcript_14526:332-1201(-)
MVRHRWITTVRSRTGWLSTTGIQCPSHLSTMTRRSRTLTTWSTAQGSSGCGCSCRSPTTGRTLAGWTSTSRGARRQRTAAAVAAALKATTTISTATPSSSGGTRPGQPTSSSGPTSTARRYTGKTQPSLGGNWPTSRGARAPGTALAPRRTAPSTMLCTARTPSPPRSRRGWPTSPGTSSRSTRTTWSERGTRASTASDTRRAPTPRATATTAWTRWHLPGLTPSTTCRCTCTRTRGARAQTGPPTTSSTTRRWPMTSSGSRWSSVSLAPRARSPQPTSSGRRPRCRRA